MPESMNIQAINQNNFMNNSIFKSLFAFLLLVICLYGCVQDEPEILPSEEKVAPEFSDGSASGRTILGDYYSYEHKVDLNLILNNTVTVFSNITDGVDVLTQDPVGWSDAIDDAIDDWNAAGSCLQFVRVSTPNAHIKIISFNDPINPLVPPSDTNNNPEHIFGWASEPSNGLPGEFIWINLDFNGGSQTLTQRRNIIGHELGHNIGFRHTDNNHGSNFVLSPAQASSIMNSGIISRSQTGLTGNDALAMRTLYGDTCVVIGGEDPPTVLSGSTQVCPGNGGTYTLSGGPNGVPATAVSWNYSANLSVTTTSTSATITVNYALANTYIEAVLSDGTTSRVDISTQGPTPTSTGLAVIAGPSSLQSYQTELYSVNSNAFNSYTSVQWVVYSFVFPNAAQHFNVTSPAGNNPFNATVEVLSTAPTGTYYVQCRVNNACGTYIMDKQIHVQEGPPQIFPSF